VSGDESGTVAAADTAAAVIGTPETVTPTDPPSERFLSLISRDFARRHLILSGGCTDDREVLLIAEDSDQFAVHNTGTLLGTAVERRVIDREVLARLIDEAYEDAASRGVTGTADNSETNTDTASTEEALRAALDLADKDLLATEGKGPVVKLVDAILFEALGLSASDLHIQPLADRTLVRFRVDGVLHIARELPTSITAAVISRIKVMGRMDIAEQRIPQDGRASVSIGRAGDGGRSIDLRISSLPTSFGERVVIRLLDTARGTSMQSFDSLGMPADIESAYLERAARANGLILMTGPTGSGKTTTLYTTLKWIASRGGGELNVMTIEDPIEYELSDSGVAISQSQVNTKKGITFASGLRHILRQDPDVVMVGEIRDAETARIAIQASLTGHLVFSTLHTNDAPNAVTRLVDLGVEPYLVSSSLSAVLAQRLVRRTHAACEGAGCKRCLESGYSGRTGLFELLTVDESLRHEISTGATASKIRRIAQRSGMRTLREDGQRLLDAGLTSRTEIERVTVDLESGDEHPRKNTAGESES
jgi:general secretion pathway protein E